MNVKIVLVHVSDGRHQRSTTQTAIRIAERFGADVAGCYVVPNPALALAMTGPGGIVAPQVLDEVQAEADRLAAVAEQAFREQASEAGRPAEWRRIDADGLSPRSLLAREAHYADVVVIGQHDPEDPRSTDSAVASDLLVDSGRPLILVPRGEPAETVGETVLLAWNDSRQAARAMRDALPFLLRARTVAVVEAVSGEPEPGEPQPAARAVEFLRKHGVNAHADPITGAADRDVADALLRRAGDMRADMIVMGGYSHSRLRQGLFGGTTRDMIERTTVATLMCH